MKTFVRWMLALCFLLGIAALTFAQSRNTGEIRGTVTDASGAALPNAVVTLTNLETGEVKTFTTNGQGIYDTVSTPAGRYRITFAANGFKKTVREPVELQVNVIAENAAMEIFLITPITSRTEAWFNCRSATTLTIRCSRLSRKSKSRPLLFRQSMASAAPSSTRSPKVEPTPGMAPVTNTGRTTF